MDVSIDRDGCIGCGLCAGTCPEVFGMDEDNLAQVVNAPNADNLSEAMDAADACPVGVITVEG